MTGKEYASQIKKITTQIKNKAVELRETRELGSDLCVKVLEEQIGKLVEQRLEIIKTIEQLPEAEYDVLHQLYVQDKTLYEIADSRGASYSLTTTIHGRALKRLESIINTKK